MEVTVQDHIATSIPEDHELICWGCGLGLRLPSYTPIFKCGWCGAITNENPHKHENGGLRWRRLRDRIFVSILLIFMLFMICGGVWASNPFLFSISYFCGVLHCAIAGILSASTISTFTLSSFRCAGAPPDIRWGSYPFVEKGKLDNYTFCAYCSKPKSPSTHHCRSCGMCILDMDHHCPFIGNCVGAANHRSFIIFLLSALISTLYITVISAYVGYHLWPPLAQGPIYIFNSFTLHTSVMVVKEIVIAFLNSVVYITPQTLILVYLFIASFSMEIGLGVLLWQQIWFIYEGKTYLTHLSSQGENGLRDCRNVLRFFGFSCTGTRLLPIFSTSKKIHKT